MKKVVVIGVDGATWNLLEKLIPKKLLPNLDKLRKEGVFGNLTSSIPPITAPAWSSFITGKNPGKHNIYDFIVPEKSLTEYRTITSKDIKSRTLYEYLNIMGHPSIIINLPVSYPPRTNDIIITSLLTKGNNFAFPEAIKDEIPEMENYRIFPNAKLVHKQDKKEYFEDIRKIEKIRFNIAKYLFHRKPWTFFFLLFSGTDWVQHAAYNELYNSDFPFGHPAFQLYSDLDKYIGYFRKNLPKDALMIIMSDHGFKTYNGIFYVNRFLEEEKLLKLRNSHKEKVYITEFEKLTAQYNKKFSIRVPYQIWKMMRVAKLDLLYFRLKNSIPLELTLQIEPDPYRSAAYYLTFESLGIYINLESRFRNGSVKVGAEYESLRKRIFNILAILKKKGILSSIWFREEIYSGPYTHKLPDIVFLPGTHWPSPLLSVPFKTIEAPLNHHELNGIFLAYGKDVKKGVKIENATIYDIAPTILHYLSLPIPKDLDGKVLLNIFKDDSAVRDRIPKYVRPEFYTEIIEKKRLKGAIANLKRRWI